MGTAQGFTHKMKKNLEILGVERTKDGRPRVTKAGVNYARINTSEGWWNCFNATAINKIEELIDKTAALEIREEGDFRNILKCFGEAKRDVEDVEVEKPGEIKQAMLRQRAHDDRQSKTNNYTTMYTSYAKDIFCEKDFGMGTNKEDMQEAIKLVKQAKEAFE